MELRRDHTFHLYREVPEGWEEVEITNFPVDAPEDAKSMDFAFDGAARPQIAYESVDNGGVFISQFDALSGQNVVRGPYAGHTPVLLTDYNINSALWDEGVWDANNDAA